MIEFAIRHDFADATDRRSSARYSPRGSGRDADIDIAFQSTARALALFGDSGAGKTTVLNAIAGLLRPSQGRIVLDGQTVSDSAASVHLPAARRHVGYVFQDGRLFPHMGVRANLLYGARSRHAGADSFEQLVDLLDLQPLLARRPATLSGGERQRVAIGRALLSAPRILLLDEPLTGLHHDARSQVTGHLHRIRQTLKVALILVSHQPADVMALADDIVRLGSGRVTGRLTPAEFSARFVDHCP